MSEDLRVGSHFLSTVSIVLCRHRILTKVDDVINIQKSRIFANFSIANEELLIHASMASILKFRRRFVILINRLILKTDN